MTMMTADSGVETFVAHHDVEHGTIAAHTKFMWLLATFLIGTAVGAVVFAGLGGIILWAVGMTWAMLAFLVVMTAGG